MNRLNQDALEHLPPDIDRPAFDRGKYGVGVVHLGIGAFHRAHQAVFWDRVLAGEGGDWRICGVSLRRPDVAGQLNPQDGLYTVLARDEAGDRYQVVGAVEQVLVAPDDPARVLDLMAAPTTHIVSLTVTEKGYCHDPATGRLRVNHPDIEHDLAHPSQPKSAPGFIVEALARRRAAGLRPFTVLCCDNLPTNGKVAGAIVTALAKARDPALGRWVAENVTFPSTMIDRIVPATTDRERALVAEALGFEDRGVVVTEPFIQWVVEDRFCDGRPDLAAAGVELVEDVLPYETMKIRLLNGSHSTLAYLGYLAGYAYIRDTMRDPAFVTMIRRLMDQCVTPTLSVPAAFDLERYKDTLIERFANPTLEHRTHQIAMDGSQKLPQRFLETLDACLHMGAGIEPLALAIAGWMRYVTGIDEEGRPIEVQDPMAERFNEIAAEAGNDPARLVHGYLGIVEIFPLTIAHSETVIDTVTRALESLYEVGAQRTVRAFVSG